MKNIVIVVLSLVLCGLIGSIFVNSIDSVGMAKNQTDKAIKSIQTL